MSASEKEQTLDEAIAYIEHANQALARFTFVPKVAFESAIEDLRHALSLLEKLDLAP